MLRILHRFFRPSPPLPAPDATAPTPPPPARRAPSRLPTPKGALFRISGIPRSLTPDALAAAIASAFSSEEITLDAARTTLAPSCSSTRTLTALVAFLPHAPRALDALPRAGTYEVELPALHCDISIDRDFHGLTPVYPSRGAIRADIVAIAGLDGHAYGAWRSHGTCRRMWLADFMRADFNDCRTMVYGYDAGLESRGTHTVLDFANSLLEELTKARGLDAGGLRRPIVFIGHGFGGIIIAQALVRAKETHADIFDSTRATLFFSTPHRGLLAADILAMLGQHSPRTDLLHSIEPHAEVLASELSRFIDAAVAFRVVSFVETHPTQRMKQDEDGTWTGTGEFGMLVPRSSAVLCLPSAIEQTLALEGDHWSMVRFQHRGALGYTSVVRHVTSAIGPAAQCVDSREITEIAGTLAVAVASRTGNERALSDAAARGRIDTVQALLGLGASLSWKDRHGNTALHRAVQNRHAEVVRLLLEHGADIAARGVGQATALIMAAAIGNKAVMMMLWERGASVAATDGNGHTVLHAAAQNGYPELVGLLLDGGVQVGAAIEDRDTPLTLAAAGGWSDVVVMLLHKGAVVGERGPRGFTALHSAAENGHGDVVLLLLEHGADVGSRCFGDCTPMMLAASEGHREVVEILLENGVDVMERGPRGLTALHLAAQEGHVQVVRFLLGKGADVKVADDEGRTAIERAAACGFDQVVKVFLDEVEVGE